jgi:hypothetical protein
MWDDAGYPDWEIYEVKLGQTPPPTATREVTLGKLLYRVTTLYPILGRLFKKKEYLLDVHVWQGDDPVRYGTICFIQGSKK